MGTPRQGICLLFFFLLTTSALGQSTSSAWKGSNQVWDFGVWASEAFGSTAYQSFGSAAGTMFGFHASRLIHEGATRTLEYDVEVQPLLLVTRPQRAYGGGFSPIGIKWNLAPHGRYRPYLQANGGAMFTQKNVPPGRTNDFNFTVAGGPGVMIALNRRSAISVDLRYWHLSNGYTGRYNPSFNTVELSAGYHWLVGRRPSRRQVSQVPTTTQAKE